MDELKPCPFVPGGDHELTIQEVGTGEFCVCCKCGAQGPIYGDEALAVKAWNTRHPEHEEIRRLRGTLEKISDLYSQAYEENCRHGSDYHKGYLYGLDRAELVLKEAIQSNPEQTNDGDDEALMVAIDAFEPDQSSYSSVRAREGFYHGYKAALSRARKDGWREPDGLIFSHIPGKPHYMVSNRGDVFSENKGRWSKLSPYIDRNGYPTVDLGRDGTPKNVRVHRLVADAFIPNTEQKPMVNHLDHDKQNNMATNLEWVTAKENIHHEINDGLHNLGKNAVSQYSLSGEYIDSFESCIEAKRQTGVDDSDIGRCAKGTRPSAGGYLWRYGPPPEGWKPL